MRARCRSCGARLVWATTAAGEPMPLDAEPVPGIGNVRLADGRAEVLGPLEAAASSEVLYTAHFATCPDAAMHRKRA